MSIISGPILTVNSTKILCVPSLTGKRQLTIYSNAVVTPDSNVMCLPVPNPHTVKFERVQKDIFAQCDNSFNVPHKGTPFSIQSHGSYEVMLVPSIDDIPRIPPRFTTLSTEVIEFLIVSYPNNFGIILCKLKKGSVHYEPIAYSHEIQNKQLFFPTKHFHIYNDSRQPKENEGDEEVEWLSNFGGSLLGGDLMGLPGRKMPTHVNTRFADDWDHNLYSICTPTWCHNSKNKQMRLTNSISWSQLPVEFQFGPNVVLRCKEIIGHDSNVDIEILFGV